MIETSSLRHFEDINFLFLIIYCVYSSLSQGAPHMCPAQLPSTKGVSAHENSLVQLSGWGGGVVWEIHVSVYSGRVQAAGSVGYGPLLRAF